ncbi:MAG: DNA recombination protein RmuC [Alphaproteobacteria bacterium]|nr:DNA recombination protein RmuC [Alphaproteobacteria bacterium]
MSIFEIVLLFIVAGIALILGIWFGKKKNTASKEEIQGFMLLQQQMQSLQQSFQKEVQQFTDKIDGRLDQTQLRMQEKVEGQFKESQKIIANITEKLTQVQEGNKQVFDMTTQLQNLEKVLTHSKQRGTLGEASLELTLSSILPPTQYTLQYQFPDKKKVDAVIHLQEGILPVDAKFSLDNYRRCIDEPDTEKRIQYEKDFKDDLKKRIDETAQYVRPDDGTLPFAFMYIPAEGIYYDLLVNEVGGVKVNIRNLIEYAQHKKIMIVSPTTFAAYLTTVLSGMKAYQVAEQYKEIIEGVETLGRHINAFDSYMQKLGNSIATTVNSFTTAHKELKKIDKDVVKITDGKSGGGVTLVPIEKPHTEIE